MFIERVCDRKEIRTREGARGRGEARNFGNGQKENINGQCLPAAGRCYLAVKLCLKHDIMMQSLGKVASWRKRTESPQEGQEKKGRDKIQEENQLAVTVIGHSNFLVPPLRVALR